MFFLTRWMEDQPVAERAVSTWKNFTKDIAYLGEFCKSSRPSVKSYETLVYSHT